MKRVTAGIAVFVSALVAAAAAPTMADEKYALVVGVNDYLPTELPSLQYAEADAEAVAAALDGLGFSVVTMTSRAGVAFRPTTADKIIAQAARRLEDRAVGDTVVIALSGHGVQFKGDGDFYFCPAEAKLSSRDSLVPMSRLMREIGGCRAGRKLLLVDACRDELTPESVGKSGAVIELEPAGVFRAEPPAGTVALLSCRAKEKSFEVAALGHSVFTHHVVEYLSGRAPADRYPSAGDVSVSELAAFVRSRTRDYVDRELAQRQTPDVITPDGTLAEWPLGKLGEGRRPVGGDLASVDRRPAPSGSPPAVPQAAPQRQEAQADDAMKQFVSAVVADNEDVWGKLLPKHFQARFQPPGVVLFSDRVQDACGSGNLAAGPFYCPLDKKVYVDFGFYKELKRRFGAEGDFAHAYVIAHEFGHHVQNLLGITEKVRSMRPRLSDKEYNTVAVRMELQADFLAGVCFHHQADLEGILDEEDIRRAVNAAAAIGDDRIQKRSQDYVVPDAFTHGTSEQRVRWFLFGLKTGNPELMERAMEVDNP